MKVVRRTFLAFIVVLGFALASCAPQGGVRVLAPAQQLDLKTLTGQLSDPGRSSKTKLEAAELLLNRPYPQATQALQMFLADSSNPAGQLAVAEAITRHGGADESFIKPLLSLMTGPEPPVRLAGGRALAAYKNDEVTAKLIRIAADTAGEREIRLIAVQSLGWVLDRRSVVALVLLLDDKDKSIGRAAARSLAKVTNIRTFGEDSAEWRRWWARNKHKDRQEWLVDLTDSLNRTKDTLEIENAHLRDRLTRAMTDLYAATPPARRETMLLDFLKDPMAGVRMVGTKLTYKRVAAGESVSGEISLQVRSMLGDPDPGVRQSLALLLANLGDASSLGALLGRLKIEQVGSVRQGLLTALGRLRDPEALQAVLVEIPSRDQAVSSAAAVALGRIVAEHPLSEDLKPDVVKALIDRYRSTADGANGAGLREAILSVMGNVGDKSFASVLSGALKDDAPTVRLAAADAMGKLGDSRLAVQLAPLISDRDRGVRQAAIGAIGSLGGKKHLREILSRTDPSIESDAAVRKLTWSVAMDILSTADAENLRKVAETLASRPDASDQRIRILQMLVEVLSGQDNQEQGDARRRLGMVLREANRPAEAEPHLAKAWNIYSQIANPDASAVWREWIGSLLDADDPTALKIMNDQVDDECFATAMEQLNERLGQLKADQKHSTVILLTQAAMKELPHRLTAQQRDAITDQLAKARLAQTIEDQREVGKLVEQLQSPDPEQRKTASTQIQAMGKRALRILLEELKKSLTAEKPDAQVEAAILELIVQIAPELKGYDLSAPLDEKIKLIDTWMADRQ